MLLRSTALCAVLLLIAGVRAQDEDEEDADEEASEVFEYADDSELSFIEMEEDIIAFCDPDIKSPTACEDNSSLNTSIGSSQESSSAEVANKLESDSMTKHSFDIAAQMNLTMEKENDLSFDSLQGCAF